MMKKIVCFIILACCFFDANVFVYAEIDKNVTIENSTAEIVKATEAVEDILFEFESDKESLQKKVDETMEKQNGHPLVRLFRCVMYAISKFCDATFETVLKFTKVR